jgi:hypothetical protein
MSYRPQWGGTELKLADLLKPSRLSLLLAALLPIGSRALASQTITVSANPSLLRVNTAVAGSQPTTVTNATTTYTVTILNGRPRRITGRLLTALPPGVTLTVTLAAPPGATSMGPVALDLTERDLVINIPRPTTATRTITYQLSANVSAGVLANMNRNVRFRIRN